MLISDIKSKPYPPRKTGTTQTVQSFKAITDGALQKHSIGNSPLRRLTELPPLPATAFTIRLWARFAFRQKHRLSGDCSFFPQKLCFCGSPELLSARTVAGQKYHCPDMYFIFYSQM